MKSNSYGGNFYACDFETTTNQTNFYKETGESKVWLAYAKRFNPSNKEDFQEDEILTTTIEDFFEEFWKRKESATLFFHNLEWDGEFIKWYLVRNGYEYFYEQPLRKTKKGFCIFEDGKTIYHINIFKQVRYKKGIKLIQLYIKCSLKLLTLSIEKLAQAFNLPCKQSINYHVEPFESLDQVPKEFIDYIKTDVNIMIPPLIQYNEVFTIYRGNRKIEGLAKLTIGATSLSLFKSYIFKQYNFKEDFMLPYDTVCELQRWYSGGLTTYPKHYQYKITEELDGRVYDVNSMYPSVMVDNPYPIGEPFYGENPPSDEYNIKMVKIFIKKAKIKEPKYPPLLRPWISATMKYAKGTRFVMETENAIAYYFQDELDSLSRFYDIEYIVDTTIWFKSDYYFKEYITKHYEMRKFYKEIKDPRQQMFKLLLNNCYGKFGEKPDKTTVMYSIQKLEIGETIYEFKDKKNKLIIDTVRNDNSCLEYLNSYICYYQNPKELNVNVAIAACITKNARLKLYDAIFSNLDNFLYCDTDSVFIKGEPKGLEIDPNKLGAWDLEATFDAFELGGAKLYNLHLKNAIIKRAHAGINGKWAKDNLKKGDIIVIDKELGLGSDISKKKVKGGLVIVESNYTIKPRH